jgi:hypothetical protein
MLRLVERQLVVRPPRKNHECDGEAQDPVKGAQPPIFPTPGLRHAFHFSDRESAKPQR